MNILSIQSHVAYGHVGNSAAVFALQRLGVEVWPVHTVQFSNHTGYGAWRGEVFGASAIGDVLRGIDERGVFASCAGVLSGYLGDATIGAAILDAVARVKRANPAALYCCDPVIGDVGKGVFVRPGIEEFLRARVVPAADILTPNHFELERLVGRRCGTTGDVIAAVDALHAAGPRVVLVTSLETDDTQRESVGVLASDGKERFRVRTPRLPISANGAGDLLAALFLGRFLREGSLAAAVTLSVASVHGVLRRTCADGAGELALISAQEECAAPSRLFPVERL